MIESMIMIMREAGEGGGSGEEELEEDEGEGEDEAEDGDDEGAGKFRGSHGFPRHGRCDPFLSFKKRASSSGARQKNQRASCKEQSWAR